MDAEFSPRHTKPILAQPCPANPDRATAKT
jgi:hypothetical protein